MGFSNPIVAGTKLVREAIESPNYVAGTTGWSVRKDGVIDAANLLLPPLSVGAPQFDLLSYLSWKAYVGQAKYRLAGSTGTQTFNSTTPQAIGSLDGTFNNQVVIDSRTNPFNIDFLEYEITATVDLYCDTPSAGAAAFVVELQYDADLIGGVGDEPAAWSTVDQQILWTPKTSGERLTLTRTWHLGLSRNVGGGWRLPTDRVPLRLTGRFSGTAGAPVMIVSYRHTTLSWRQVGSFQA